MTEDAPNPPQVSTYDVWSRKDAPPSRKSYTPPPLEEGAKPTPAPWNRAYSLNQDHPEYVPPTLSTYNTWGRKDSPPARESYTPPSGNKPPVWHPSYAQVLDDGGVHITKAELDALIMNDYERTNKAYDYNGVANPASKNYRALTQYQGHWVDSKKIDDRVEEFVNRNVHEGLDANWPRNDAANQANGYKNPASGYGWVDPDAVVATPETPALYQRHHGHHFTNNDISEKQIDEQVHEFSNPKTETLNWARSEDAFKPNGSLNPASGYGYVSPDTATSLLQHYNRHNS